MVKEASHHFIRESTSNDKLISKAVERSLSIGFDNGELNEIIEMQLLEDNGPRWLSDRGLRPVYLLERFHSPLLWEHIVEGYSGETQDLVEQKMVRGYVRNDAQLAALELEQRASALNATVPLFSVAAVMGKDIADYFTYRSSGFPIKRAVVVAGKMLFEEQAESIEVYIERMKELFPEEIRQDDLSAFDLMHKFGAFSSDGLKICPGVGLTRKLLQEFGKNLHNGFDIKLASSEVDPSSQVR